MKGEVVVTYHHVHTGHNVVILWVISVEYIHTIDKLHTFDGRVTLKRGVGVDSIR